MKKLIPFLLAVCLLATPMAANVSADDRTDLPPVSIADDMTIPEAAFSDGSVPAQAELTEGIFPPLHALVLALYEHELSYDIHSAPFVWTALYYTLGLYGEFDDRAELTNEALLLPSEAIQDFARALFADLDELPALPAELADFVCYDSTTDIYSLSLGDFAQTQLRPGTLIAQADGSYILESALTSLEDSSTLCSFRVTLLENESMFGFSVAEISLF